MPPPAADRADRSTPARSAAPAGRPWPGTTVAAGSTDRAVPVGATPPGESFLHRQPEEVPGSEGHGQGALVLLAPLTGRGHGREHRAAEHVPQPAAGQSGQ